jgi:hypothetical protein
VTSVRVTPNLSSFSSVFAYAATAASITGYPF